MHQHAKIVLLRRAALPLAVLISCVCLHMGLLVLELSQECVVSKLRALIVADPGSLTQQNVTMGTF
jgi:hypothetical protein